MELFLGTILPILIVVFVLAGAVVIYVVLKGKNKSNTQQMITKNMPKTANVALKEEYVVEKQMQFLACLTRALPKEMIAFPQVGVDRVVVPTKDKVMYNAIGSQYLDIVVFLRRGMKPVLALDLYEEGGISEKLKEMDENVARTLKAVKLPVLKCPVRLDYDVEELRMKVIQSLNPEIVALLKENFTHQA